ncbi:alpha/beta hydrolase [Paenibacillus thermotolerans]|uniref:alpha/beta hydrolase n=1 Tax=Paenibacillus thermotolerans TaxID=3027807 RepID=UPI0023679F19|nr:MULTISPECIES: alpha/beta hydrolase [unclassified Paenibacillus]
MNAVEGTFIGYGGVELFYRKFIKPGVSPKGVVVAVHGHGDHSGGLSNITDMLAENDYAAYAFDMRGHGKSPGIRGFIRTWDEYRGDLHAFRELAASEHPEAPLYIVAHSLGGVVGLDYLLFHGSGVAGIALIAPAISYEVTRSEKWLVALLGKVRPQFTVTQSGDSGKLTRDADALARLNADTLRHNTVTPGLGLGLMQAIPRIMKQAKLIRSPLLLQYGLDDEITPHAKLREFINAAGSPEKISIEYEGVRHRPFDDLGRDRFLADLLSWLDRGGRQPLS